MVPQIIHYTWFSGDPFPAEVQKCINSWHKYMPEYEFVLWNSDRLKEIESGWLTECLLSRKWAFAADFVRLYAVYNYGGIYLDTDVEVFRSFDSLLNKAFIGKESDSHSPDNLFVEQYLTSHCFGAEPHNMFVGKCLNAYEGRHFIKSIASDLPQSIKYDLTILPLIQSEIAKQFGYSPSPSIDYIQEVNDSIIFYPSQYFDPKVPSVDSFCKHYCLGGWRPSELPVKIKKYNYYSFSIRLLITRYLLLLLWGKKSDINLPIALQLGHSWYKNRL